MTLIGLFTGSAPAATASASGDKQAATGFGAAMQGVLDALAASSATVNPDGQAKAAAEPVLLETLPLVEPLPLVETLPLVEPAELAAGLFPELAVTPETAVLAEAAPVVVPVHRVEGVPAEVAFSAQDETQTVSEQAKSATTPPPLAPPLPAGTSISSAPMTASTTAAAPASGTPVPLAMPADVAPLSPAAPAVAQAARAAVAPGRTTTTITSATAPDASAQLPQAPVSTAPAASATRADHGAASSPSTVAPGIAGGIAGAEPGNGQSRSVPTATRESAQATSVQPSIPQPTAAPIAPTPQVVAPAAQVAPSGAAASATPVPFVAQLSRPIFTLTAAGAGEHVMTISVTPDTLGPVTVRAHVSADGIRVELFAPSDLGRDAIRHILPDLRRDLASSGLNANLNLSSQDQPTDSDENPRGQRFTADSQMPTEREPVERENDLSQRARLFGTTSTIDVLA